MRPVKQLLVHRSVFSVEKGETVQAAAEHMARNNIGAVTVMDGTRLVGIFSERDVINRVVAKRLDPASIAVGAVMTSGLIVAGPDDSYELCLKKMKKANCRHLPVVEQDTLIGVISLRDLLEIDITEKDENIEFLYSYMFHVAPDVEKKYGKI